MKKKTKGREIFFISLALFFASMNTIIKFVLCESNTSCRIASNAGVQRNKDKGENQKKSNQVVIASLDSQSLKHKL